MIREKGRIKRSGDRNIPVVIGRERERTRLPVVQRAKSRRAKSRRRGGEGGRGVGGEVTAARAVTSIAILAPKNGCVGYARRDRCVPMTRRNGCASPGPCRPRRSSSTRECPANLSPPPLFSLLLLRTRAKVETRRKLAMRRYNHATARVFHRDSFANLFGCCYTFRFAGERESDSEFAPVCLTNIFISMDDPFRHDREE